MLFGAARADADPKRECHLHEKATKVKLVGCYEAIESNSGEHTYGRRACFFVANGVCSGTYTQWDGNLEGNRSIFDDAKCGTKDGAVAFTTTYDVSDGRKLTKRRAIFSGKITKAVLRGTVLTEGTTTKEKARWALASDTTAVSYALQRVRETTAAACGAATASTSTRP